MAVTFNSKVDPKAKTELFKIYVDVSEDGTEELELQGRGIGSWTIEQNQEMTVVPDVLGLNDFERGVPKPQQSVELALRKNSQLGELLFDAWFNNDMSKLDNITIVQKFEFISSTVETSCLARKQIECAMNITQFMGEAENYLKFGVDIYYSNNIITGTMPITDGNPPVFNADT